MMKSRKSMHRTYYLLSVSIFIITLVSLCTQLIIMRQILFTNTQKLIRAAHQQSYDNIDQYLNNIENSAISIGYNASVQRFLKEPDSIKQLSLFSDVQTVFSGLSVSQSDVQGYALYDKNGESIVANGSSYQAIIQSDTVNQNSKVTYSSTSPNNPYIGITVPYYIITVPVLEYDSIVLTNNRIGTIVLTMDLSFIKSQVDTGNQLTGYNMILLDEEGRGIISIGRDAPLDENTILNDSHVVFEDTFSNNGWRLVTFFEKDIIADNMIPLLFTVVVTSVLIFVLFIAFVLFLSRQFISPIEHISHFMSTVSHKASESITKTVNPYYLPKKWGYAELLSMSDAMNDMLHSLEEKTTTLLIKEKQYYEVDLARHRNEVFAYRNQINPHFLYNTFECIKGIALSRNALEIVDISQALSQMFRHVVKGDDFVTIGEEITHVQEYALIIYYRFMGRITIKMDAMPNTNSYYVPRIILQPLVENAVFHGLEKKIESGTINVNIFEKDNFIHIIVSDDGIGMDAQTMERVLRGLEDPSNNNGIGLSNIAHRIRLLYSNNNEIKITSIPRSGTRIELILPAIKEVLKDVPSYYSR